jgi:hypothetical protein
MKFRDVITKEDERTRLVRIYGDKESGGQKMLDETLLDPSEILDEGDVRDLLAAQGWPSKKLKIVVLDNDLPAAARANYICSKIFAPVLFDEPEVLPPKYDDYEDEKGSPLIEQWTSPEGMQAIVEIMTRIVQALGPAIANTIRDIERAKFEEKLAYDRARSEMEITEPAEAESGRRWSSYD